MGGLGKGREERVKSPVLAQAYLALRGEILRRTKAASRFDYDSIKIPSKGVEITIEWSNQHDLKGALGQELSGLPKRLARQAYF